MKPLFDKTEYQILNLLNSVKQYIFHGKRTDNDKWVEGYYFTKVYSEGTIEEYWAHIIKDINTGIEYEVRGNTVSIYLGFNDSKGNKLFLHDIVIINTINQKAGIIYYDTNRVSLCVYEDIGRWAYRYELITTYPNITRLGSAHDITTEQFEMIKRGEAKFVDFF